MAAVKGLSVRFRGHHLFFVNIPKLILFLFLGLLVCFTALPLIYVVSTAFKPIDELYLFPPRFTRRLPKTEAGIGRTRSKTDHFPKSI